MSSGSHSTLDWPSSPSGRPASHFSHQITQICKNSMHLGLLEEKKKKQNQTKKKQTPLTKVAHLALNTMCKEHLINTTFKYTICICRKKPSASYIKITQLAGVTYTIIT